MKPIIDVRNLNIVYELKTGVFNAVKDVSFSIQPGQIMGLAGESGSGKTTVGLSILNLLHENGKVSSGEILFEDQNLVALTPKQMRQIQWKQISMVFQGAMNAFNPVQKMGEQMIDVLTLRMKMNKKDALERVKRLMEILGIDKSRINHYPHEFSGGMRQRAMMAMALICNPKLVIADEPTTALDVMVKAQMLQLLRDLRDEFKLSMIIVSHDLAALAEICDTVAIMNHGELVEFGTTKQVFHNPQHPYTQHLVDMIPRIDGESQLNIPLLSESSEELMGEHSCVFAPCCPHRMEQCFSTKPQTQFIGDLDDRYIKCHLGGNR